MAVLTNKKWYQKLLTVLLIILFLPLILTVLLFVGVYIIVKIPKSKIEYKKSAYFAKFGIKYIYGITDSPQYRFYNAALNRSLPIEYGDQDSNGFEYFKYNGTIFLFPDFDRIFWNEESSSWLADYDGDVSDFEAAYSKRLSELNFPDGSPIKLIVEREMLDELDLSCLTVPDSIYLINSYEDSFGDDSMLIRDVPKSTQELYDAMLNMPDLCGEFGLHDGNKIIWHLFDNADIVVEADCDECYVSIDKTILGGVKKSLTHWHPSPYELYSTIIKIGKKGNVLVVYSGLLYSSVLYCGKKDDCPYKPDKKHILGKQYYFETRC